jgi:hypothetical protein
VTNTKDKLLWWSYQCVSHFPDEKQSTLNSKTNFYKYPNRLQLGIRMHVNKPVSQCGSAKKFFGKATSRLYISRISKELKNQY